MNNTVLESFAVVLSRISRELDLAEGLHAPKAIKLEPCNIVAVLNPDNSWVLYDSSLKAGQIVPDAIVRWQSEQWAQWLKGAVAGWWPFSLQEGVAVEGDAKWVIDVYQKFRLLPWWWMAKLQSFGVVPSLLFQCSQNLFTQFHHAIGQGGKSLSEALREKGGSISHSRSNNFQQNVEHLHDAVERLEARCVQFEQMHVSKDSSQGGTS